MSKDRFTLEHGCWYGLTMFPGYGDCPYHSPIRVDDVRPLGNRQFEVKFLNLAYAAGVRDFTKALRTLRRAQSHLVAEETVAADRTYVFVAFNKHWLTVHFPNVSVYFEPDGTPDERALLNLAATTG